MNDDVGTMIMLISENSEDMTCTMMEITVKFTVQINTNNDNISRTMEVLMQNMMHRAGLRLGHKQ